VGPDLRRASALLPLAVVAIVVAVLLVTNRPDASALRDPIARVAPVGPIDPDAVESEGAAPPDGPGSPHGEACLERIARGNGWVDLCWSIARDPHDTDPAKDYYLLHLYGSHEGLRFLTVRSDLSGNPGDGVMSVWPTGTIDGQCDVREVNLSGYLETLPPANVCGRTVGDIDGTTWSHTVTWTCEGCQAGEQVTRGFDSLLWVGVPAHTVPSWDLFADASA
jgi:hypothetical protein